MIFVKNWTFLLSLIFFEKDLDIMFKYALNKKNFLDYKNRKKGLPHDFRQKLDISSESQFLWKRLDIMFKYPLNKKNFLDYKNVILTYSEHDHFSKGGNPGFSSKIGKFFWVSFSLKKTYTWRLIMFWIKKGFLQYKNVILTKWDNVHFA